MNAVENDAVAALLAACEQDLGDPSQWTAPVGHPDSLALCLIDAIYTPGARYGQAAKVVEQYRGFRVEQGGDADTDGVAELLATFDVLGGPLEWATRMGNRRPVSTAKGAPLRAAAIFEAARGLSQRGVSTAAAVRDADDEVLAEVEKAWREVPGQRSGLSWNVMLALAGAAGLRADRIVTRYVAKVLDSPELTGSAAAAVVAAVAGTQGWDVGALDHWIWLFESGRLVSREIA